MNRYEISQGEVAPSGIEQEDLQPVSLRRLDIREGVVPEGGSVEVQHSVNLRRFADQLTEQLVLASSIIRTEMDDKIDECTTASTTFKERLQTRYDTFDDLANAVLRTGISLDMALSDISVTESYIRKRQQQLEEAHDKLADIEKLREATSDKSIEVSDRVELFTTGMGKLVNDTRETLYDQQSTQIAESTNIDKDELFRQLIALKPQDEELEKIIGAMSRQDQKEYYRIKAEREVIVGNLNTLMDHHRNYTDQETVAIADCATIRDQLAVYDKRRSTLIASKQLLEERLHLLARGASLMEAETTATISTYGSTAQVEKIDMKVLGEVEEISNNFDIDTNPADRKKPQYHQARLQNLVSRQLPDNKSKHLVPVIATLEQIDENRSRVEAIDVEISEIYETILHHLKDRKSDFLGQIYQSHSDITHISEALINFTLEQDAIDAALSQATHLQATTSNLLAGIGSNISDKKQSVQDEVRVIASARRGLKNAQHDIDMITKIAEQEHEKREKERLAIVNGETILHGSDLARWALHDLTEADTLRGYDALKSYSNPDKFAFPGVSEEVLTEDKYPNVFVQYKLRIAKVSEMDVTISTSKVRHSSCIDNISRLEGERLAALKEMTTIEENLQGLRGDSDRIRQEVRTLENGIVIVDSKLKKLILRYVGFNDRTALGQNGTINTLEAGPSIPEITATPTDMKILQPSTLEGLEEEEIEIKYDETTGFQPRGREPVNPEKTSRTRSLMSHVRRRSHASG